MNTEVLPSELQISSPIQLQRFLLQLAAMLQDGRLKQCFKLSQDVAAVDVAALAREGQWPDIIEAEFVDASGRHYELFVDCYHGAGGVWRLSRTG
jgi:hypothetical protein